MKRIIHLFRNFPIQRKINFAILLTCGTALAVTAVAIFGVQLITFRHNFNRDLEAIGRMVGQTTTASITFKDREGAAEILAAVSVKPQILRASLELPDGSEFAAFKSAKLTGAPVVPKNDGAYSMGPYLVLNQPVVLAGERIATLRLLCDYQTEYSRSLRMYATILGSVLVASVLLALLLSNRLKWLISAPILSLAEIAQDIAEKKDYSLRAPLLFHDEVGQLTTAFNEMVSRIQTQDAALALSQRKLEALVNSIEGIVWECIPDMFQFTFVSQHSERLLGYTPEQWLASPNFWPEHIHTEDVCRAMQSFQGCVDCRQPSTCDYRMIAADGREVWIRHSGVALVENDKTVAVRGIFIDITAQKQAAEELEQLNRQLIETSRQAGMAEVATGVLHNVGNVLTSVNVSANLIKDSARNSRCDALTKVCGLLEEHRGDLGAFLTTDPKGQRLPEFLTKLSRVQEEERARLLRETQDLLKNVEHVKEIVSMQQTYAKLAGITEDLSPATLIEDALRINEGAFLRHGVTLKREFDEVPAVRVDKHKVLQILVNLLSNAKYAMDAARRSDKILTLKASMNGNGMVKIMVRDNGIGIAPENLTRIFGHGFTTKKDGHGFGLHSSANAAKEMGGSLQAFSDGSNTGATFILELPIATEGDTTTTIQNGHEDRGKAGLVNNLN